jgi:hypothetical protein
MGMKSHTLIRAVLPHPIDTAIKHLAVDLCIPVTKLMVEAAILLLRCHDRGAGLPPPMPPCSPGGQASQPSAKKGGAR